MRTPISSSPRPSRGTALFHRYRLSAPAPRVWSDAPPGWTLASCPERAPLPHLRSPVLAQQPPSHGPSLGQHLRGQPHVESAPRSPRSSSRPRQSPSTALVDQHLRHSLARNDNELRRRCGPPPPTRGTPQTLLSRSWPDGVRFRRFGGVSTLAAFPHDSRESSRIIHDTSAAVAATPPAR